jgi:hypothetical protein
VTYPIQPGGPIARRAAYVGASAALYDLRNALNTKEAAYDFRASSVTLSGAEITACADVTGNGHTLTPTATGPDWNATGKNGLPTATFVRASSEDLNGALTIAAGTRPNVFMVGAYADTTNDMVALRLNLDAAGTPYIYTRSHSSGFLGYGLASDGVGAPAAATKDALWHRFSVSYRAANFRSYVDNSATEAAITGTLASGGVDGLHVGWNGISGFYANIEIAYIDVAAAAPSDADETTGDGYAATAYGI